MSEIRVRPEVVDLEDDYFSVVEEELLREYDVYGLKSCLGKMGKISAAIASSKQVVKLNSFDPTKIGDYL